MIFSILTISSIWLKWYLVSRPLAQGGSSDFSYLDPWLGLAGSSDIWYLDPRLKLAQVIFGIYTPGSNWLKWYLVSSPLDQTGWLKWHLLSRPLAQIGSSDIWYLDPWLKLAQMIFSILTIGSNWLKWYLVSRLLAQLGSSDIWYLDSWLRLAHVIFGI